MLGWYILIPTIVIVLTYMYGNLALSPKGSKQVRTVAFWSLVIVSCINAINLLTGGV